MYAIEKEPLPERLDPPKNASCVSESALFSFKEFDKFSPCTTPNVGIKNPIIRPLSMAAVSSIKFHGIKIQSFDFIIFIGNGTLTLMIANILVFRGVPCLYTYLIPDHLHNVVLGTTVQIPFGRSNVKGLIMSIEPSALSNVRLKPIDELLLDYPVLPATLLSLLKWFYTYYPCTPYKAYQTIVGQKKAIPGEAPISPPEFDTPYPLTDEQRHCLTKIEAMTIGQSMLIHGVTGSGKTEIYIQVAHQMILQGKQVLLLVPEIGLTPQMKASLESRFGDTVAILHSNLTPKQRRIQWNRIYHGTARLIMGPRSAIFSPFQSLGAIMIDEEHDQSYKQDTHPRYHTHSVAEYVAQIHQAKLIYASATPSLDTYYNCKKNEAVCTLQHRVNRQPLPPIRVIDQTDPHFKGHYLTPPLLEAMEEEIGKGHKVLLLMNRRGYAPYIECQRCKKIVCCPECQLGMTFHYTQTIVCHRCHIKQPYNGRCPSCQSAMLKMGGLAIQKIEFECLKHFPNASIIRLDKDTGKTLKQTEAILNKFKESGDILIGTQMVAKGHHIDSITLVGILGIDSSLHLPDFRAPERAFQLITQVAGRAGRGEKGGRVMVQTTQPDHYAIEAGSQHDFHAFYEMEMENRQVLDYPPFSRLIVVIFSDLNASTVKKSATLYYNELLEQIPKTLHVDVYPPDPAPIEKIRNYYRYQILLKVQDDYGPLKDIVKAIKIPTQSRVIVDVEPQALL